MTEAKFMTFWHYKSQKIVTYSSIVHSLLTHMRHQRAMDINLTLHKLHQQKITASMACFFRTTFQNFMNFSQLLQHLSPNA